MSDITPTEMEQLSRLQAVITGDYSTQPASGELTEVLVAPNADVSALGDLPISPGTLVFAHRPLVKKISSCPGEVVGVRLGTGSAAELRLGTFAATMVEYSVAAFIPVTGLMVVRVTNQSDFAEFLREADEAQASGVFAEHLLSAATMLSDECALAGAHRCASGTGRRAQLDTEGVRATMDGGAYTVSGQCRCLDGALDRPHRLAETQRRPWLARYLAVLRTVRSVRTRDASPARVSGFGWRFTPGLDELPIESAADPVVISCGSRHYVVHPDSGRLFAVSPTVAKSVEVLGASARELSQVEALGTGLGLSTADASQVLDVLNRTQLLVGGAA